MNHHTHSFVLYNTPGTTTKNVKEIKRLGLKIKPGQGAAMQRRAINLYLRKGAAMQVHQGSSLYVFPLLTKAYIEEIGDWIKANGGQFIVFDGGGDMQQVADSLHDSFEFYLDELERLINKMKTQKKTTKALEQIQEVQRIVSLNNRFMTVDQLNRAYQVCNIDFEES